ncbi:MAG: ECF-type sigma factor, partial [candidate division Zixibacteria bacterium]|nr:ECF-type sigma factor [candidate division Zixibacteria bacterium]
MTLDSGNITQMLSELTGGNRAVVDAIMPVVYNQMHQMAERQLRRERADHTLNATALIHEAYVKLVGQEKVNWQNRAHFMSVAAMAMRRILINYAKSRMAEKRGGGNALATFNEEFHTRQAKAEELIDLDEALSNLAVFSQRQARVVELSFFGGLTHEEIAEVLKVSVP